MKKTRPIYCSKCSQKLIWVQDWAEKHTDDGYSGAKFKKFNVFTGERQIVGWWKCPSAKFWNRCDNYEFEAKILGD